MCRNFLTLFLLICLATQIKADDFLIKSLRVYSSESETSFPLIDYSDSSKKSLTIEFDVQGNYAPSLNILFKFCDKDWNPYDNAFLTNFGYNTEYNIWLERLPLRIKDARYHYVGKFPNKNVTFPFSGKWKFFIVDSHDPQTIYGEGKFYVVYPEVKLNVFITKNRMENVIPEIAALGRTITINTYFTLPDSLFESNLTLVEIVENKKISYPIRIIRDELTDKNYYEWNGSNQFLFLASEIKPGNEYRQTDLRDINRFNQKNVYAQYDGIETSNFFKKGKRDFNGGSILTDYKNEYAEYLNVTFRIRPPENINSSIFVVGAFNNWQVLPEFKMFDDDGLMSLTIELKRGVYDYQYVIADLNNGILKNIDWQILEGNFWETENDYHIFLFYQSTEKGGYDKIIGYKKINSGGL